MVRLARRCVLLAALLYGLHLFMLSRVGQDSRAHAPMAEITTLVEHAVSADLPDVPTLAADDMAAACLAVLPGLIVLGVAMAATRSPTRRPFRQPRRS